MNPSLLASPVVLLALLWGASALVRRFVMRGGESPVASGAIVMAWSIFVIAALEELDRSDFLGRLLTLELLVIWGYIAFSYLRTGLRGELGPYLREPANTFPVGTWVAGTAILARAMEETLPDYLLPLETALLLVAAAVWLWYLRLLPAAFRAAADPSGGYRANGAVLLAAVATQSLVVSGSEVLSDGVPGWIFAALVVLGYLFYAAGLVLLVRRYLLRRDWTLADDWDPTNCILHGAMSISGLAIVQSGALPGSWAVATWVWVAAVLVLVESMEVSRGFVRVRAYGWREGLFVYSVPQWSRNFTFGMFYAFSLQLYDEGVAGAWASGPLQTILSNGPYVALTALLAQTTLFFLDRTRGTVGDSDPGATPAKPAAGRRV